MKKLPVLFVFALMACHQKESHTPSSTSADSTTRTVLKHDTLKKRIGGGTRKVRPISDSASIHSGHKIISVIAADQLPLHIQDEFTNDDQQLIIKIKHFSAQSISGTISPQSPEMNIRFNQIKLPNGDYDGPFGRDILYEIKGKGEIWLIIGKSNMASADPKGRFSVQLQSH